MKTNVITRISRFLFVKGHCCVLALIAGVVAFLAPSFLTAADRGLATTWDFRQQEIRQESDAAIKPAINSGSRKGQYGEIKPVSDVAVKPSGERSAPRRAKQKAALDSILGDLDGSTPTADAGKGDELELLLNDSPVAEKSTPEIKRKNSDTPVSARPSDAMIMLTPGDLPQKAMPAGTQSSATEPQTTHQAASTAQEDLFPVEVRKPVTYGETRVLTGPATTPAREVETPRQAPLLVRPNQPAATSSLDPAEVSPDAGRLVVEHQSPNIEIQAIGPRRVIVGQDSPYQIKVRNSGAVAATRLEVMTEIPGWVEVMNIQPSVGTSSMTGENGPGETGSCAWLLGDLAAGAEEILTLHLIPRERTNFELVSHYDYERESLKAGIEVQEACLELAIEGRAAIEFGQEDKYRLRIRNAGNGDAKNVRLKVSTGTNEQISQTLGLLPAGDERSIELALKTELEGTLPLVVEAEGDYNVKAICEKNIDILRGNLEIYVESPEFQFVNNNVSCLVHVANTGTAAVRDAKVALNLPEAMRLLESSEGGNLSPAGNAVDWTIKQLDPGQELVCHVTCQAVAAGNERFEIVAADASGLSVTEETFVQVEGVAALAVKINAPNGPVALGTPVQYEVVVTNTGTKAAENVVSGLFLFGGLKPVSVDFGSGTVVAEESKILFGKINQLAPGQSQTYRVSAQAVASGNHKVQAVLRSDTDGTELLSEAMTYCYESRTVARRNAAVPSLQVALKREEQGTPAKREPAGEPVAEPSGAPVSPQEKSNQSQELPALLTLDDANEAVPEPAGQPATFPQLPSFAPEATVPAMTPASLPAAEAPQTERGPEPMEKSAEPAPLNESILGRF
ncbi:MAG: hypothetical protein Q4G68_14615 [Planctomycetia bacterium]|nr:hypothetical protein [Planctomycetia bacterium]